MHPDTHMDTGHRDEYRGPYSVLLTAFTILILLFLSISNFWSGWTRYTNARFIDYKLNLLPTGDGGWLVALFAMPLLAQLGCFIFFLFKAIKKTSLLVFYAFCLGVMSLCSFSYCWLWARYTDFQNYEPVLNYKEQYTTAILVCVGVLLLAVILVTYVIIWTPATEVSKSWQLAESDIDWPNFFLQLKSCSGLYRRNGWPLAGFLRKIYELLEDSSQQKIMAYEVPKSQEGDARGEEISADVRGAMCRELNTILRRRDLHLTVEVGNISGDDRTAREAKSLLSRAQRSLSDEETRRLNGLLLKACCGPVVRKEVPPIHALRSVLRRIRRVWESFLSHLKDGIVELHFWVLIFFFTVFLSITYLLGFAFAFHDKVTEKAEGYPALVLSKARPSASAAPPLAEPEGHDGDTREAGEANPATKVNYTFYFDSKSAVPKFWDADFVEANFASTKEGLEGRSKSWREIKNYKRLSEAAADIDALTKNGEGLRAELVGSADDGQLKDDTTYTSNYALSEARAQNVKYLLLKKLAEQGNPQRNIEWLSLPSSNENNPQLPPSRVEVAQVEAQRKAEDASIGGEKKLTKDDRYQLLASVLKSEYDARLLRVWNGPVIAEKDRSYLERQVTDVYNAIVELAKRGKWLKPEHRRELYDKTQDLSNILRNVIEEKDEDRKARLGELQKSKEAELAAALEALKYLEENESRRTVVVSLTPVRSNHQYVPLSLMDYMYFTTYTITTTGYGDIAPTTTYAKFLCSIANIIEVFFLVVFFNALLSVKGNGTMSQPSSGA